MPSRLHAYQNPVALTEARLAELAPLFDVLLAHDRPEDIHTLWVYVNSAFPGDSQLRAAILNSISNRAKEEVMTFEERLRAQGEARGRAAGWAESLLAVLEHRAITISAAMRERVLTTCDESLLRRWLDRAFSVAAADELFEPGG